MVEKEKEIQGEEKEVIRVSISEAARLFGVNPQTIRRAIQDQEITYIVVAGRYKINFESLVRWSQERTRIQNKMNQKGIGQYVERWKIRNTLYSPSAKSVQKKKKKQPEKNTPEQPDKKEE